IDLVGEHERAVEVADLSARDQRPRRAPRPLRRGGLPNHHALRRLVECEPGILFRVVLHRELVDPAVQIWCGIRQSEAHAAAGVDLYYGVSRSTGEEGEAVLREAGEPGLP